MSKRKALCVDGPLKGQVIEFETLYFVATAYADDDRPWDTVAREVFYTTRKYVLQDHMVLMATVKDYPEVPDSADVIYVLLTDTAKEVVAGPLGADFPGARRPM